MISTRIAVRLGLGVLCGLVLILLPAVFSSATPAADYPVLTNRTGQFTSSSALTPAGSLYGANTTGMSGLSFLTIILFIFLPSTVFSLFVRRWAEKRARDHL